MEKRLTIALITSLLTNVISKQLLDGVKESLPDNVDLITFTGGALGEKHIEWIDISGNIIYDLLSAERFDGIIIYGGAIGQFIGAEEFKEFCTRFSPLPVVNISHVVDGIPAVVVSNYSGVKDVVDHLIHKHKYKNICFIGGPTGHTEADERFRGYKESLEQSNIKFNKDMVTEGNYSVYSGREGV